MDIHAWATAARDILAKMLPRLTVLPFLMMTPIVLGLFAGTSAHAAPEDLAAAIPMSSPYHTPVVLGADAPGPLAAQPGVLFINFDGGDMNDCGWSNDPKDNCSWIFDGTVLPYSGDAGQRAAVVQYIRQDFEDFAIEVTDIRPGNNVDYDMEMVGDWDPAPQGGFAGVAPSIDCFNQTGGETSFTLDYTSSAGGIAKAVLQEAAHTWGLEHVDSKGDLLYPTTAGVSDPTFEDACHQIVVLNNANQVEPSQGECVSQHKQFCDSGDLQNSYQELLQIFGPPTPDLTAPELTIVSPTQGAEVGPKFDLTIHAADEQSPQVLAFEIIGTGPTDFNTATLRASPSDANFPINGLPAGAYTITVNVKDEDDNLATAKVDFTVVATPDPTTAGEDDSGAGTDTGATATAADEGGAASSSGASDDSGAPTTGGGGEDSGPTTTTGPTTTDAGDSSAGPMGEDTGDDGCSCRGDPGGAMALLLPIALGLRRRRRS